MMDEGQEEEEKGSCQGDVHEISRGSGLMDFDDEDEEFKNAQEEKLKELTADHLALYTQDYVELDRKLRVK